MIIGVSTTSPSRRAFSCGMAALVACVLIVALAQLAPSANRAWAVEETAAANAFPALPSQQELDAMSLDDLKKLVDAKAAELQVVRGQQADVEARIAANEAQLAETEAQIPVAQALAERSVRERYKMQQHRGGILDALVSATDFKSFLAGIEYIEAASEVSVDAVVSLRAQKADLERVAEALAGEKAGVDDRAATVQADLERATAARDEAQRKADMVANAHLNPDGANWDAGEEAFVAAWAPRIDSFLAGSPMQGQGAAFAKAAWANHIDPRFSPGISTIESGRGRVCIRPYNAWGWGAADSNPRGLAKEWSSWEDAINAHVRGLARGYGYTVTPEGAQKYCPYNWEEWYATTVSEMNRI